MSWLLDKDAVLSHPVCGSIWHDERLFLYETIRRVRPTVVVETGSGASTLCILLALHENQQGTLYSFDSPGFVSHERRAEDNEANKIRSLWKEMQRTHGNWHIIDGDIKHTLAVEVNKLPKIDLFFHDSEHTSEHFFFETGVIMQRLSLGGVFGMHDVGHQCYTSFEALFRTNPVFISLGKARRLELWEFRGYE